MTNRENIKEKSKEWLLEGLFTLMETRQYDDINIVDICEQAQISRATFYRHFKDKDDLIMNYFNETFNELYRQIDELQEKQLDQIILLYLKYWKTHQNYTRLLNKSGCEGNSLLCNQLFFKKIEPLIQFNDDVNLQVRVDFLAGAMYSILESWILNDYAMDVNILSNHIRRLLNI